MRHPKIGFILLLLLVSLLSHCTAWAQPAKRVLVLEIKQAIDPRTNRYLTLGLEKATADGYDLVLIEMNTYGGALQSADEMRQQLLEFKKPVWVYINKNAASAGALISIACDSIYMNKGATIGAATVVNGQDGQPVPEKYQSYMRSMMRATAEAKGRNPSLAENMVGVKDSAGLTKVLSLTTSEALKQGFCEGVYANRDTLLAAQLPGAQATVYKKSPTEKIIALVLNPVVSSLLIMIIIGGIYFELQSPGIGFPLVASIVAVVLYTIPYYLNGLAANWELVVFGIGMVLLLAEFLVIPGFGIAGIAGFAMFFGALMLMMLQNNVFDFKFVPAQALGRAFIVTLSGLVGGLSLMLIGGFTLTRMPAFKKIALMDQLQPGNGTTLPNQPKQTLVGATGVSYSVLRPSGKVMINNKLYDAVARDHFIDAKQPIKVIEQNMGYIKVIKNLD